MSKQNPNFLSLKHPSLTPLTDSLATQSQLIDSLTAHISLYQSNSSSPNSNPNSNPRTSILKWFSSLTIHQRQAYLTTVDHKFTQLLIQMLGKVRTNGHGRFIILPDLPSGDLPSLCYKKSRGLLSRTAESNQSEQLIFESTYLFWSREGEKINECSCSTTILDTVTVSEELVGDVDKFVETMDKVSNGGFLRGEDNELGTNWVELEWLKAKGYYSIEAFVANRLEVALRLAWLNTGNGKKRGVKLKEKLTAAGAAANVLWRKKGCMDWWSNLDAAMRQNILRAALGKAAKSLICEILNWASSASEDEMWLFRAGGQKPLRPINAESLPRTNLKLPMDAEFCSALMPTSLAGKATSFVDIFNRLFALLDIVALVVPGLHSEYDIPKIFFSSMDSVSTISDCILRKLRGIVMIMSLDCTKLELLEGGNFKSLPNKPKEKPVACNRRKKGKAHNLRKLNSMPGTSMDESSLDKPLKDVECSSVNSDTTNSKESNGMLSIPHGKEIQTEHPGGLVFGKKLARKSRKGKNKNKNKKFRFNSPVDVRSTEKSDADALGCSVISPHEAANLIGVPDNSSNQNVSNDNLTVADTLAAGTTLSSSAHEPTRDVIDVQGIEEDHVCDDSTCHVELEDCQVTNNPIQNQTISSGKETLNCEVDHNVVLSVPDLNTVSSNAKMNFQNKRIEAKSDFVDKSVRTLDITEEPARFQGKKSESSYEAGSTRSSSECLSYEWPSLAPVYFPSINSHLLPATDRLHLDVGRNWHSHIRQPFVPTMHQARNSPTEVGHNRMLSQPLSMSLDWPPMIRSTWGVAPSLMCNYDSEFISRRQSTFQQSFTTQNMQFNSKITDDGRKYSGDFMDFIEATHTQEQTDESESHWISEEESEACAVSGIDYNQHFGGGVMYWNPSDHPGTGFSRPPSLSSDDGTWAWYEADMKRAVDDMVAFSSSYSTNGMTSPTAAPFCSPFDTMAPAHQALGYVVSGNEIPGKVLHSSSTVTDTAAEDEVSGSLASLSGDIEGKAGDSLSYPILRPIIIPNISRVERSRSDIKRGHDRKSPCVPPSRREQPQIKRPPSPVVLCVPRAPRPLPPSPVSDSRKQRGFPTVRSGSSSPRHWGMRGWYHDGTNFEEACVCIDGTEVVWPSWRNKNLSAHPMIQPLPGALLQDRLIAMSQLARDQEHPDVSFPLQPPELQNCPTKKASLSLMHSLLHDDIDFFCKRVCAANMTRKPFINWAVKRVTRSLQVLWPRSRTNVFGSNATGLSLPTSDVDLVVCLPPVRNLEPIKEAGILEGRNGIKETCLQHAARYLANQEWVKNDSLKTVENTAIPIIMLVVEVPNDLIIPAASNRQSPNEPIYMTGEHDSHLQSDIVGLEDSVSQKCSLINHDIPKDVKSVRLDISFKSPSHTGLQTTELVKELTEQFPAATPLALILKQFLADRSLDQSYSGGLSSYCLILLITRFLQHEHHLGRSINQNFGSLLMDFLYFFGNVFDPRQMRISVQGTGLYINRERGYSIDPIHIDDPLFPTNNVGRNCFRIHQCIKAFSEAYSILENELTCLPEEDDKYSRPPYKLLQKIIPSINLLSGI